MSSPITNVLPLAPVVCLVLLSLGHSAGGPGIIGRQHYCTRRDLVEVAVTEEDIRLLEVIKNNQLPLRIPSAVGIFRCIIYS